MLLLHFIKDIILSFYLSPSLDAPHNNARVRMTKNTIKVQSSTLKTKLDCSRFVTYNLHYSTFKQTIQPLLSRPAFATRAHI